MNLDALNASILVPAILAGILVISTHVPLGQKVLSRGIIFIDLAIAQVAGLGVIVASAFEWGVHGWQTQVAASTAAVTAAVLLYLLELRWGRYQEAVIGVLFVLAATASILVLSENPHGGEHLRELLVGQILFVSLEQLWPVAILYTVVLGCWWKVSEAHNQLWFYLLFALTVTASVQLVGVYLVFSSLIIPALATTSMQGSARLVSAYALGVLGFVVGLTLSALFDLPSGAVVVWTLALCGCVLAFFLRSSGSVRSID